MYSYSHILTCQTVLLKLQTRPLHSNQCTVLIFLGDFSSIVLVSLLLDRRCSVKNCLKVKNSDLAVDEVFVDFVLALLGDRDADV